MLGGRSSELEKDQITKLGEGLAALNTPLRRNMIREKGSKNSQNATLDGKPFCENVGGIGGKGHGN